MVRKHYGVQWGLSGFNPGSGSGDTTRLLTLYKSIRTSTAYDVYVQGICAIGDTKTLGQVLTRLTLILGPQGMPCSSGSYNCGFINDLESQGAWTGDFGTGMELES